MYTKQGYYKSAQCKWLCWVHRTHRSITRQSIPMRSISAPKNNVSHLSRILPNPVYINIQHLSHQFILFSASLAITCFPKLMMPQHFLPSGTVAWPLSCPEYLNYAVRSLQPLAGMLSQHHVRIATKDQVCSSFYF